jgi:hypothetical protein
MAFISCKQRAESEEFAILPPIYQGKEFTEFYEKFSTDSLFQMEHTVWPLEGTRAMKDSTDIIPENFRWEQKDWVMHRKFDDKDGTFLRSISGLDSGLVIEMIEDQTGVYSMERRFGKLASGWHLIYYREMGRY